MFYGLFWSCRGGRDWCLTSAPRAVWSFDCTWLRSQRALDAQLAAAEHCLTVRGRRPTAVKLQVSADPAAEAALGALAGRLGGAGAGVSELVITHRFQAPSNSVAEFISTSLPALFPSLTTLTLTDCAHPLPAPAQGPEPARLPLPLRSVRICAAYPHNTVAIENAVTDSLAPYLKQLHTLEMSRGYAAVDRLFTPETTTNTLQQLSVTSALTEQLLTLLLRHAPSLVHLGVRSLYYDLGDHSNEQWGVSQLKVGDLTGYRGYSSVAMLARLPRSSAPGRVCVVSKEKCARLSLTAQVR